MYVKQIEPRPNALDGNALVDTSPRSPPPTDIEPPDASAIYFQRISEACPAQCSREDVSGTS